MSNTQTLTLTHAHSKKFLAHFFAVRILSLHASALFCVKQMEFCWNSGLSTKPHRMTKGPKLKRNSISSYSRVWTPVWTPNEWTRADKSLCSFGILQLSVCHFRIVADISKHSIHSLFFVHKKNETENEHNNKWYLISVKSKTMSNTTMSHKPWHNLRFYSKQSFFGIVSMWVCSFVCASAWWLCV